MQAHAFRMSTSRQRSVSMIEVELLLFAEKVARQRVPVDPREQLAEFGLGQQGEIRLEHASFGRMRRIEEVLRILGDLSPAHVEELEAQFCEPVRRLLAPEFAPQA